MIVFSMKLHESKDVWCVAKHITVCYNITVALSSCLALTSQDDKTVACSEKKELVKMKNGKKRHSILL